jgi:hypothetical protein
MGRACALASWALPLRAVHRGVRETARVGQGGRIRPGRAPEAVRGNDSSRGLRRDVHGVPAAPRAVAMDAATRRAERGVSAHRMPRHCPNTEEDALLHGYLRVVAALNLNHGPFLPAASGSGSLRRRQHCVMKQLSASRSSRAMVSQRHLGRRSRVRSNVVAVLRLRLAAGGELAENGANESREPERDRERAGESGRVPVHLR